VEIRDMRFICYPRSCSGECEPLRPENFIPRKGDGSGSAEGGKESANVKYQHCRAFEYRQRQLIAEGGRNAGMDDEREVIHEKY